MNKNIFLTVSAVAVFTFALVSCGSGGAKDDTSADNEVAEAGTLTYVQVDDATEFKQDWSTENTVVYHFIGEPDDMHPSNGNSASKTFLQGYTQNYVLASDIVELKGGRPDVVKAMPEISENELEFTYELRDEPTWDDGAQLTMEDVIFTFKANKCPLTNNPHAKPYLENLAEITVDAENPRKFTLKMKRKYIQNIVFLTDYPLLQETYWDPNQTLRKYTFAQFDKAGASGFTGDEFHIKSEDESGNKIDHINIWQNEGPDDYGKVVWKAKDGEQVSRVGISKDLNRWKVSSSGGKSGWVTKGFVEVRRAEKNGAVTEFPDDLNAWATEFNDAKYSRKPEFLVGMGPYRFSEWKPGQSFTLTKKKNHWTHKLADPTYYETSYPDKIIFKINSDPNSQALEFKTQALDASTYLSVKKTLELQKDPNFNANYHSRFTNTYNYSYMAFNCRPDGVEHKKFFEDKRVRRAVAMLISVDEINAVLNKGKNKRMVGPVSPLKKAYNDSLPLIDRDLEGAKMLLEEAGWTDTDNDNILDKIVDGEKLSFEFDLHYMTTSVGWRDEAQMISEALYEAGLKCNIVPLDFAVHYERARNHKFDAMLAAWAGSSVPSDFTQIWHSESWASKGSNFPGFGSAESDALVDSIKYTLDDGKRIPMVKKLQTMIYEEQPYVFLFASSRRNVIHKRFGNADMYFERPGVLINNFKLLSGGSISAPEAVN